MEGWARFVRETLGGCFRVKGEAMGRRGWEDKKGS